MPLPAHLPALSGTLALLLLTLATVVDAADQASGPDALLLTAEGRSQFGPLTVSSAGGVTVGSCNCPIDRVVELDIGDAAERTIDEGVVLTDGQILRGVTHHLEAGKLELASDLLGVVTIDEARVSVVMLNAVPVATVTAMSSGPVGARFPNGETSTGKIDYLNALEVGIDSGNRIRRFPRERVEAIILRPAVVAGGCWLQSFAGDRLTGSVRALTDSIVDLVTTEGELKLPLSAVHALWNEGSSFTELDRLKVDERHDALIEAVPPARCGAIAPCEQAPEGLRHGILAAAGTHLNYEVLAGATLFVGHVAAGPGAGGVTCVIQVDAHQVFTSGVLHPQGAGTSFAVPVAGAHQLVLSVAPAVDDTPGCAVWSWPTLVR